MRSILFCVATAVIFSASASTTGAQSLEGNQLFYSFLSQVKRIQRAIADNDKIFPMEFFYCVQSYDKLIASGVSPSARAPQEDAEFLPGTLAEAKQKWCVDPEKKVDEDWEAKKAPYKAVLKADKLRLLINENSRVIYRYALAGGKYTDDADALATAKVWFLDVGPPSNEAQNCLSGGRRSTVRRYTFDAGHKLMSTTEKAYCGTPPASAYR